MCSTMDTLRDPISIKTMMWNLVSKASLIARFMGPTWGPSVADRTQASPMLAPWICYLGSTKHTSSIQAVAQALTGCQWLLNPLSSRCQHLRSRLWYWCSLVMRPYGKDRSTSKETDATVLCTPKLPSLFHDVLLLQIRHKQSHQNTQLLAF